jgi:hypothetical protein
MRYHMLSTVASTAALASALVLYTPGIARASAYTAGPLVEVSSAGSPFAGCTVGGTPGETNFPDAEVEPRIAVNPLNPKNMIGVWQQDRWQFGGSHGLVTAYTTDGGATAADWHLTYAHFSTCAGGTAANGGNYERASDPWVTFGPDGTAYQISLSFDANDPAGAVLVSKSKDGGATWSEPTALIRDSGTRDNGYASNDKESVTADPTNSKYVYAVWDRFVTQGNSNPSFQGLVHDRTGHGPAYFSRSTDGGATWEPARNITGPEARYFTINNQIVVLPNGDLVDEFTLFSLSNARGSRGSNLAIIRSTDKGLTWSKPIIITPLDSVPVFDPATGQPARTGDQGADITVDPKSGALYIAWEDARFSSGDHDGIVFSKSLDGGLTWSTPIEINHASGVAAFTPTVQVASDGTVGVGYYDFRNDNPATDPLLTDYWLVHSHDGGTTWTDETRVTPTSFDLTTAPFVDTRGYFLGDYEGMTAVGKAFVPLFVQANSGNFANRTDVFTTTVGP